MFKTYRVSQHHLAMQLVLELKQVQCSMDNLQLVLELKQVQSIKDNLTF